MGPEVYFWYAGAQAAICAWALRLAQHKRAPGALIIALGAGVLVYDNAVLGVGHLLGEGQLLETLSLARYGLFVSIAPVTLIAALRIGAAARVRALQAGPWLWGAWAIILALLAHGFWFVFGGLQLEPACIDGTLRYSALVTESQLCSPGQEPLTAARMPISVIVSDILVAIIGAAICGKRAWPWLFVGSIVVFVAAKFPPSQFGPFIGNASAIAWMLAFAVSSARFASMPADEADTFASRMDFNDTASFATRTLHKEDLQPRN